MKVSSSPTPRPTAASVGAVRFFSSAACFFLLVLSLCAEADAVGTVYTGTPGRAYIDACDLEIPTDLSGGYGNVTALMMPSLRSKIRSMLAGKTLRVAAMYHKKHTQVSGMDDPGYKSPWPDQWLCAPWLEGNACDGRLFGREYDILQTIGDRGNFQLEWSVRRDIDGAFGETYTALAVNFTTDDRYDFDISGNWWTDTMERRKLGLVVGHHHLDASRVLVTRRAAKSYRVKLDLLLSPFSNDVWLLFLLCMLGHSVGMTLLERTHLLSGSRAKSPSLPTTTTVEADQYAGEAPDTSARDREEKPSRSVAVRAFVEAISYELWMSFERFNGGDHHSCPKTNGGRLLMSIWGLFTLVFVSLYTAALAAVIIASDKGTGTVIRSTEDVRDNGGRVLIPEGDPVLAGILNAHPYLKVTEVSTAERRAGETSVTELLDKNNAVAYIMSMGDARRSVLEKKNCDVTIASTVAVKGGGFITSIEKCKDRLHVILDALLMEVENDGTLQNIERKYAISDQCEGSGATAGRSPDATLNLRHTVGLFVLTGGAMACAFALSKMMRIDAGDAATKVVTSFRIQSSSSQK